VSHHVFHASILAVAVVVTSAGQAAFAAGYWNMPGNVCQCIGCGFGAGYHAPLLLGPISHDGWLATNERRLPYPPAAPYAGCGLDSHGYEFAHPTMMEPLPQPTGPVLRPVSKKHRPLFLR
jgi:hypothetical protein